MTTDSADPHRCDGLQRCDPAGVCPFSRCRHVLHSCVFGRSRSRGDGAQRGESSGLPARHKCLGQTADAAFANAILIPHLFVPRPLLPIAHRPVPERGPDPSKKPLCWTGGPSPWAAEFTSRMPENGVDRALLSGSWTKSGPSTPATILQTAPYGALVKRELVYPVYHTDLGFVYLHPFHQRAENFAPGEPVGVV